MEQNEFNRSHKVRILTGLGVNLIIALIHIFRLGSYLNGKAYILYYSFASDVLIPIGFYFLLCMNDQRISILQKWSVKAIMIFGLATTIEILQAFGIYFLGETFDPLDIFMFALGVLIAVFLDKLLFEKLIPDYKYPGKRTSSGF
jgi:hypothetical protein